jgi:hypothetical protein
MLPVNSNYMYVQPMANLTAIEPNEILVSTTSILSHRTKIIEIESARKRGSTGNVSCLPYKEFPSKLQIWHKPLVKLKESSLRAAGTPLFYAAIKTWYKMRRGSV